MKPGLPDDTNAAIAQQWREVAATLESAAAAWEAVSADSAGPLRELLHDARWNASVFQRLADGANRRTAWQQADDEVGQRQQPSHILYDPAEAAADCC